MKKAMTEKAVEVKVKVKKVRKVRVGQGDVTTLSIGDGQRGASVLAGERGASIADSTGQSWASTFSRFRYTQTAVSLAAILLPRDARTVVSLNANRPEIVEAQLPLLMTMKPSFERLVGSLPLTMKPSAGPYTSCSISTESHESLTGSLPSHRVATLIPPATVASRGSLTTLAGLPGSRIHQDPDPGARYNMAPPPTPSRGRGALPSPGSPQSPTSSRSPSLTMEVTTDA